MSALATLWLGASEAIGRAFGLQRSLGAGQRAHPGGTLLDHLGRVYDIVREWNTPPRIWLAAICHASYGTDGFPHGLVAETERRRVQDVIGRDAESLVYLYGACDRKRTYCGSARHSICVADRFTGGSRYIRGSELHDFAVLTIANELDIARHAALSETAIAQIRSLITGLASCAPHEAAIALTDNAFAT